MIRPLAPQSQEPSALPLRAPRAKRRLLASFARITLVLTVLLLGVRWSGVMESIAFIHPRLRQFKTPEGVEDVYFTTPDGLRLHGWFIPAVGRTPESAPGPVVLHCHGNEGAINVHASWSSFMTYQGISVFIFDYRSFGRSADGGRWLTRTDLMRDSEAALAYLKSRSDVDPTRIGVYGVSLGGSFALALAAEDHHIACAAGICTFSSWPSVASDYVPGLAWILIQSGLAQADSVAHLGSCSLLLVHGDHDSIVPYRHAPELMKAAEHAGVGARLLTVPGAGHLNILTFDRQVPDRITEFFVEHLHPRS